MSMPDFFFFTLDLPFSATEVKRWEVHDALCRTTPIKFGARMARIWRTATGIAAREMVASQTGVVRVMRPASGHEFRVVHGGVIREWTARGPVLLVSRAAET